MYVERQLDKQLPRFVKEERRSLPFAQLGGDDSKMLLFLRANFITEIASPGTESGESSGQREKDQVEEKAATGSRGGGKRKG